jgi:hypothetical protein
MKYDNDQGKPKYSRVTPVPLPLCPPQILHGMGWEWSQTSVVGSQRLTDRAMAQSWNEVVRTYVKILLQYLLGSGPRFNLGSSRMRRTSTFRSRVSWECSQVRECIGSQFKIYTMGASTLKYINCAPFLERSRETSIGLVTKLLAGRPRNRSCIPDKS